MWEGKLFKLKTCYLIYIRRKPVEYTGKLMKMISKEIFEFFTLFYLYKKI